MTGLKYSYLHIYNTDGFTSIELESPLQGFWTKHYSLYRGSGALLIVYYTENLPLTRVTIFLFSQKLPSLLASYVTSR